MPDPAPMTVADILQIAIISGAAGGVIAVCTQISVKQREVFFAKDLASFWPMLLITAVNIFMGAGASIGVLFIFHFLQLLHPDPTLDNQIFLISSGVIAGIGAQRLIPTLTDSLTQKINSIEKEAAQTKEIAEETAILAKASATLESAASDTERLKAIDDIKSQLSKTPLDRTLTIILGRLYRKIGNIPSAISSFESFIKRKEDAKQFDRDLADVLYNLSCYFCVEWEAKGDVANKTRALEALRRSVSISPENKVDAKRDEDFAELKKHTEFAEIVS